SVFVASAMWAVLSAGAGGLAANARRKVRIFSAVVLGAWLGSALVFAPEPASILSRAPTFITPLIPIFAVVSIVAVALALRWSSSLRSAVADIPLPALIGIQVWRTFGVTFIVLLIQGQLPAHFALPAGWGDIFIGVTAPLVALALAVGARGARTIAV